MSVITYRVAMTAILAAMSVMAMAPAPAKAVAVLSLRAAQAPRIQGSSGATLVLIPGQHIHVTVRGLPLAAHPYCIGLASEVDRGGLPVSLGLITRDGTNTWRLATAIPARILPAEPAGLFMLFVGTCTAVAPDGPFLVHTTIRIMPAA